MDCKMFEDNISSYLDGELKDIDKIEFELHLLKCKNCRQKYENMINIVKLIKEKKEVELPEDYHNILMEKVKIQKRRLYNNLKTLSSIAAALLLIISSMFILNTSNNDNMSSNKELVKESQVVKYTVDEFSNKSNNVNENKSDKDTAEIESKDTEAEEFYGLVSETNKQVALDDSNIMSKVTRSMKYGRKLVRIENIELSIQPYDDIVEEITEYIEKLGGYVEVLNIDYSKNEKNDEEDEDIYLKNGIMKLRVTQDKFEDAVDFIKSISDVEKHQHIENDITQLYSEKEEIINKLKNRENEVSKMIEQVNNTDKIIKLEKDLKQIRIDIERNTRELQNLDCIINMPEINLKLKEMSQEENT